MNTVAQVASERLNGKAIPFTNMMLAGCCFVLAWQLGRALSFSQCKWG